jgi:translation initiation factor 3 subunit G
LFCLDFEDVEEEEEKNLKTVTTIGTNDRGQTVKIVKKIRVVPKKFKINKAVLARKTWKKFGDCADLPAGPEPGITSIGDDVQLEVLVPVSSVH